MGTMKALLEEATGIDMRTIAFWEAACPRRQQDNIVLNSQTSFVATFHLMLRPGGRKGEIKPYFRMKAVIEVRDGIIGVTIGGPGNILEHYDFRIPPSHFLWLPAGQRRDVKRVRKILSFTTQQMSELRKPAPIIGKPMIALSDLNEIPLASGGLMDQMVLHAAKMKDPSYGEVGGRNPMFPAVARPCTPMSVYTDKHGHVCVDVVNDGATTGGTYIYPQGSVLRRDVELNKPFGSGTLCTFGNPAEYETLDDLAEALKPGTIGMFRNIVARSRAKSARINGRTYRIWQADLHPTELHNIGQLESEEPSKGLPERALAWDMSEVPEGVQVFDRPESLDGRSGIVYWSLESDLYEALSHRIVRYRTGYDEIMSVVGKAANLEEGAVKSVSRELLEQLYVKPKYPRQLVQQLLGNHSVEEVSSDHIDAILDAVPQE